MVMTAFSGVVLAREQQQGPHAREVRIAQHQHAAAHEVPVLVWGHLVQHRQLLEVGDPLLHGGPELDLLAEALGFPDDLLRRALVVPEAGFEGALVERGDALFLGG